MLRLRDDLDELREEERRRWDALQDRVDQLDVVDETKIRAHLLSTVGDTYRRELAAAEAAPSWQERERLREAAAVAKNNRLSRVDEVVTSFAELAGTDSATDVFEEMNRVLQDEGVDDAIAYAASQRLDILGRVRSRRAAARDKNRAEMQPLLQTAALYETRGQNEEARDLYDEIIAEDPGWPEALGRYFWFLVDQGDEARVRGSLPAANRDYRHAHGLAQTLTAQDPSNTTWQRDLSVSYNKIGDVLVAQGDGPGALDAYRQSLEIAEALAAQDPSNTEWQRDLSVSHERIGNVLLAQGDGPGALDAYRQSLEISEALTAQDPSNTEWQTDLAVSCANLGALEMAIDTSERRYYLTRGRGILMELKTHGRLLPSQDRIGWFDERIAEPQQENP